VKMSAETRVMRDFMSERSLGNISRVDLLSNSERSAGNRIPPVRCNIRGFPGVIGESQVRSKVPPSAAGRGLTVSGLLKDQNQMWVSSRSIQSEQNLPLIISPAGAIMSPRIHLPY